MKIRYMFLLTLALYALAGALVWLQAYLQLSSTEVMWVSLIMSGVGALGALLATSLLLFKRMRERPAAPPEG